MDIFEVCRNKNIKFIKKYIKKGSNINITNEFNWTPLRLACEWNNIEMVKLLLKSGANINAINGWNQTHLDYLNDENKIIINHFINNNTNKSNKIIDEIVDNLKKLKKEVNGDRCIFNK